MRRQIILDTETTGLSHAAGHRVIEIGCLEMVDRSLTGEQFHVYLNPDRAVDAGAAKVHGIQDDFLKDKPRFPEIMDDLITFIDGAELIIHNAPFDTGFLDAELKRAKHKKNISAYCSVLDTLVMAKQKHPGQRNNLDALCKRYDVVNSHRKLHGALLDSELLALVYLAMTGGQTDLFAEEQETHKRSHAKKSETHPLLSSETPIYLATEEEVAAHEELIKKIAKKSGTTLWAEA